MSPTPPGAQISPFHHYLVDGSQHLSPAGHTRRALAEKHYTLLQLLNDLLSLVVLFTQGCQGLRGSQNIASTQQVLFTQLNYLQI